MKQCGQCGNRGLGSSRFKSALLCFLLVPLRLLRLCAEVHILGKVDGVQRSVRGCAHPHSERCSHSATVGHSWPQLATVQNSEPRHMFPDESIACCRCEVPAKGAGLYCNLA